MERKREGEGKRKGDSVIFRAFSQHVNCIFEARR